MIPEVNQVPKQKFHATIYVNMELSLPIEAINGELAAGLAQLAAEEMIQKATDSPGRAMDLLIKSQLRIKGVNVKPHERST